MSSADLTFDITARDNASAAVGKVAAALQRMDRTAATADKTHRTLGSTTGRVSSGLRNMAGVLGTVAAGYAAIKIAQFGKDSIRAASDLQEATSATGVMFGKQKAAIIDWSKSAAQAFGQSRTQAMQSATYFGTLGKAAGLTGQKVVGFSKQMVTLGSDLASFFNTSPAEAMEALGAGLRGESEPLRRYGVLLDDATLKARAMKMGIYEGTGSLTQQQRVLAAHAEILRQTGKAQGDFARTSQGWANQTRVFSAQLENLKATAGKALLPIATDYIQRINRAMPQLESGIRKVAPDIGRALIGVSDAVADNWPQIKQMFGSVADAGQRLGGVLKAIWSGFDSLPAGVKDAALQLGAIAAAMKLISNTGIGSALKGGVSLGKTLTGVGGGVSSVRAMNVTAGVVNVNGKVTGPAGPSTPVGPTAKPGGMPSWLGGTLAGLMNPIIAGAITAGLAKLNADRAGDRYASGDHRAAPEGSVGLPGPGGGGFAGQRFVSESNRAADAARRAERQVQGLHNTMSSAGRVIAQSARAQVAYRQAVQQSTAAARRSESGIRGNTQAAQRNRDALRAQGSAATRLVALLRGSGAESEKVTARQRQLGAAFVRTARDMGVPTRQARELARSYGLLPPRKNTKVDAPGARQSKRDIDNHNRSANRVPRAKNTRVDAPNARQSEAALRKVQQAADSIPPSANVNVSESGAAAVVDAAQAVGNAVAAIDTSVTINVQAVGNAAGKWLGGQMAAGGLVQGFADGGQFSFNGLVLGPGTSTSDSIGPVMLSNGEYVIRAASVDRIGVDRLHYMNRMGELPRFKKGGPVKGRKGVQAQATIGNRTVAPTADAGWTAQEAAEINAAIDKALADYRGDQSKRQRKASERYKPGDSDKIKRQKDRAYEQRIARLDDRQTQVQIAQSAKQSVESRLRTRRQNQAAKDREAADALRQYAADVAAQQKEYQDRALSEYETSQNEARAGIGQGLSAAKSFASVAGFDLQGAATAQEELRLAQSAVNTANSPAERAQALAAVAEAQAKVNAAAITPANVMANFRNKLAKVREFKDALVGLRDRGLNPTTLSEIAQMDPDSGLTLAKAIAGSDLAEINGLQSQLLTVGGDLGALAHNANMGADAAANAVMDSVIARGGVPTTVNVNAQLYLDGKTIYESQLAYRRQQGLPTS